MGLLQAKDIKSLVYTPSGLPKEGGYASEGIYTRVLQCLHRSLITPLKPKGRDLSPVLSLSVYFTQWQVEVGNQCAVAAAQDIL